MLDEIPYGMTEEQYERACIMHFDGGVPWEWAVLKAKGVVQQQQLFTKASGGTR